MNDTDALQQTVTDVYQYNYVHIESVAMADTLPASENFSQPWVILAGIQAIKLAINTLIANQGDQGKQGVEDDVQKFVRQAFLKTLQAEEAPFKHKLMSALGALLPRLLTQLLWRSPAESPVAASRGSDLALDALEAAQPAEVSQAVEVALQMLLDTPASEGIAPDTFTFADPATSVSRGVAQPLPDAAAVSRGIDIALQKPLMGIPGNELEVEAFLKSNLMQLLGEGFLQPFAKNLFDALKVNAPKGRPASLDDYRKLFAYIDLPPIADKLHDDETFAYLRVAGFNPAMLQQMTALDPRFPVTQAQYETVMQSDSLDAAIAEQRIYWLDYAVLDGALNGTYGTQPQTQKYLYAPMAMFAVPPGDAADRLLCPVAIQCGQSPASYPIITPSTGAEAWMMAKTIVQIADANFHEAVTHFARTHLLIEPFVIATHRQLPATHPLSQLLLPHFQGTIAINYSAHQFLVAPQGGVNGLLSSTIDNSRTLIVKGLQARGFNADMLPRHLKARGVEDASKLPVYPYRDDSLLIWAAIHDWVEAYLKLYYSSDQQVRDDRALQSWSQELVALDGGRVRDFGDAGDGRIETLSYLADALTMVIFTGSAQHAAVNFPQYDIMSFAPAVPTAGYAPAEAIGTEQDWLNLLPPLDQAQAQLNLLFLLGSLYFTRLGQYEANHFTDVQVREPLLAFQNRLKEIEATIDRRNLDRPIYEYLKPSNIPQSINI